jgi:hypothetical protein
MLRSENSPAIVFVFGVSLLGILASLHVGCAAESAEGEEHEAIASDLYGYGYGYGYADGSVEGGTPERSANDTMTCSSFGHSRSGPWIAFGTALGVYAMTRRRKRA